MMHKTKVQIPSRVRVDEHYVAPCIKCDCDIIKIEEYEDKYGFISTAKCTECKQEAKENCGEVGIIKAWNKQNDIPTLLTDKAALIISTKKEIEYLKSVQKLRAKKLKVKRPAATKNRSVALAGEIA